MVQISAKLLDLGLSEYGADNDRFGDLVMRWYGQVGSGPTSLRWLDSRLENWTFFLQKARSCGWLKRHDCGLDSH